MFGKALFVIVKDWKILHHPKINYDKFKQWNTMQPLKILLQKNLMTWDFFSHYIVLNKKAG